MTMMVAQPAFAGAGVTELSFDEVHAVAGGPAPLIKLVVPVAAAIVGAIGGNAATRAGDDCTTRTTTTTRTMPDGSTRTVTVSETVCS